MLTLQDAAGIFRLRNPGVVVCISVSKKCDKQFRN